MGWFFGPLFAAFVLAEAVSLWMVIRHPEAFDAVYNRRQERYERFPQER